MADTLVPYALASSAKRIGFKEECPFFYGRQFPNFDFDRLYKDLEYFGGDFGCFAPTLSQLAAWLRATHGLHVNVQHNMHYCWQAQVQDIRGYDGSVLRVVDESWLAYDYSSYEAALTTGLIAAVAQVF